MTAVLDDDHRDVDRRRTTSSASPRGRRGRPRSLLDVLPGVAVVATMALLAYTTPVGGWLWWVFMAAIGGRRRSRRW